MYRKTRYNYFSYVITFICFSIIIGFLFAQSQTQKVANHLMNDMTQMLIQEANEAMEGLEN